MYTCLYKYIYTDIYTCDSHTHTRIHTGMQKDSNTLSTRSSTETAASRGENNDSAETQTQTQTGNTGIAISKDAIKSLHSSQFNVGSAIYKSYKSPRSNRSLKQSQAFPRNRSGGDRKPWTVNFGMRSSVVLESPHTWLCIHLMYVCMYVRICCLFAGFKNVSVNTCMKVFNQLL